MSPVETDGAADSAAVARRVVGSTGADPTPSTAPAIPPLAAGREAVLCPHADCAQANPAGRERCLYCNRPLRPPTPGTIQRDARPLPSALRDEYQVLEALPAAGAEADLLIVRRVSSGETCIAKLYRKGLEPDLQLLALLSEVTDAHIARLLTFGVSDGTAYEVQEYIGHGTLRQWLQGRLISRNDVRRIAQELAAALNEIHAKRILHRDLKPENVLVRSSTPLELALTDFGIASLREATQHFTGGARTAKYAAPEALTGVIDEKADWWACGMIALEAATGRHPFEGLNEQVIDHWLATRPIDVRGIYDDALRTLCRGLLVRDPKRRWGASEVARWLADDPTLPAPDDAAAPANAVKPYRIGKVDCTTGAELAAALAREWGVGARDLARGQVARWIENELHDYNLVRKLRDLEEERGMSADLRLLRFLLLAAPDLPAVWRGAPVSMPALLAAARASEEGDEASEAWLESLVNENVLSHLAAVGHAELAEFDQRWRAGWTRFTEIWQGAQAAEDKWRKQPKSVAGVESSRVVNFDDLVFGASHRLGLPARGEVNAALILALGEPSYVAALRGRIAGARAETAGFCPWYDSLWAQVENDDIGILVAQHMLPHAKDDATFEKRRQRATEGVRGEIIDEARAAVRSRLADLLRIAATADRRDADMATRLLAALRPLQEACQRALGLGFAEVEYRTFCRGIEKIWSHALAVQEALARYEEIHGINALFMRPERILIAILIVSLALLLLREPWFLLGLLLLMTCALGYRWYVGLRATEHALAALRLLRLHGRAIVGDATTSGSKGRSVDGNKTMA